MPDRSLGTTRMILYAAARVLGCGSVQMALVDDEGRSLVFRTSITNRELPVLDAVEATLGFQLEGAHMPLAATESMLVRALRDGRVLLSQDPLELAGGVISDDQMATIKEAIGRRSFACVPIVGRVGAIGILIFERRDELGFTAEDRDLMVAYADRVGADLESQALSDDARRLEQLAESAPDAPVLYACDRQLTVVAGASAGRALWDALGVAEGPLRDALARLPTAVSVRSSTGKMLRVSLAPGPGDTLLVAAEDLEAAERLRREAARAREHLAKVLRSVGDTILTLDSDGRVTSANEAVEQSLGHRPEDLVGSTAIGLCADERGRRRAQLLRHSVRAGGFAESELRLRRRDGGTFPALVAAMLLADDQGGPAGMVWRIHDLTEARRGDAERKRLRARLLHSERLSALGEMAARIAHEVRNPLVSIGAAAQVVAEELPAESHVHDEVKAIAREVRRLDAIVTDFLRFARPRRAERRPIDLATVVRESVDLVRAKAAEVALELDEPLYARCDPDGVKQVLLNVLLNAVEAAPAGTVECEARLLGDTVVVSVTDRGPGISESARRRAFDPFFSTKTRGTGLGLAVSKQIVDEHHGRIRLLTRRGGGTRVVIELPVG
jgi:PAS domain S-box-containing protein